MSFLNWIDDISLVYVVEHVLKKAEKAKAAAKKKFGKNVIDPFSAMFEMAGFGLDHNDWIQDETNRQAQKSLQNHVGEFHQLILGSCKGWQNMKTGNIVDLVSHENRIVAEVKNKWNTVTFGKLSDVYYLLEGAVMPKTSIYKGYTAYYVAIIPERPLKYDIEFTPSDKEKGEKCSPNAKIRTIDGASFYAKVTGHENALDDLFKVLPEVISVCCDGKYSIDDEKGLQEYYNKAYKGL
jgi:hypothetical protein